MSEYSKRLVLPESRILERVQEMAARLDLDFNDKNPLLIGVLNGVFRFMCDLTRFLTIPAQIDFVRIRSYSGANSSGAVQFVKDLDFDIRNRYVVVVEDIVDSGYTLQWFLEKLKERGAADVKTCVLIDKIERRTYTPPLDYVGFKVEEGFLVGYGLDYNEDYRLLNDIYHLEV
jgi:hypoxanthine phosphoribosyltransferase